MIQPRGESRPNDRKTPRRNPWRPVLVVVAGVVVAALVATGVTLGILQLQSRTNSQQVNLRAGVTIAEESAIVQVAANAKPAVVTVLTQEQPALGRGSGYLITSDGYIVTAVNVIAGATALNVLLASDAKLRAAHLVDYDCQTGVAVLKIDQVGGLPTLAFADPTALVQGQVVVAVGGPLDGGVVTPGYVSSLHRPVTVTDPMALHTVQISDTVQTNAVIGAGTVGGPLLNVGGQVVGVAMQSQPVGGSSGFGLNTADIQDEVQQIVSTGQVIVSSLGATSTDLSLHAASLVGLPEGSQLVTVDTSGPAAAAGLQPGDVITQLDDVKLDSAHPLRLMLRSRFHPNQRVQVTYFRSGGSTQVQLTLTGQHPACG
ncbi:MAG: S1C family serine protease [Candidatus Dormibacteraeota bacterium]|nr:S1C family serine protease [Candidatus Dormibacteraeota bacterium]